MQRRYYLITVIVFAALVLASYFALAQFDLLPKPAPSGSLSPNATVTSEPSPTFAPPSSTKSIVRNANTTNEKTALQSAEDFDYPNASNTALYSGEYANFIDTDVINYYSNQADSTTRGISLNYRASSNAWNQATVAITENSLQVSSPTQGSVSVVRSGSSTFAYLNDSQYQPAKEGTVNLDLPTCYVVQMNLEASEVFGPTNGFWNEITQLVVLDSNFKPVAFGTQSEQAFS